MTHFLRRHVLLLVALAGLGWCLAVVPGWAVRVTADPLDAPLPVEAAGARIERDITVQVHSHYTLAVALDRAEFERAGGSFDSLRRLVGGDVKDGDRWTKTPGVPVPLRWSVHDRATGALAAAGAADTGAAPWYRGGSWGRARVSRTLGRVTLAPSRYAFRAELLAPAPALAPLRPRLVLWTSHEAAPYAAALATELLVRPALVLALVYLAAAAFAEWQAARRQRDRPAG